ncbi:MAG: pyruvate formate lyase family protein, partial [Kiritimatiellia bacterium]
MPYQTFAQDREYLWNKFRQPVFDTATGLDNAGVMAKIREMQEELDRHPRPVGKAMAFKFVADNIRIDVNPHDWFVGFACWNRHERPLAELVARWNNEVDVKYLKHFRLLQDGNASGITNTWKDFDHSVPDWDAMFSLGFPGLRERARKFRAMHAKKGTLTEDAHNYFKGIDITCGAMIDMLERFRSYALEHADGNARVLKIAECLDHLARGRPGNIYEALQFIYLYFMFSEHIDMMQVRSLGNLDRMLYPYYVEDVRKGTFTDAQIREIFDYFLMQYASINNYWGHPFYIGGTNADGSSEVNYFSRLIVEEFDKLSIVTPKIQVKVA